MAWDIKNYLPGGRGGSAGSYNADLDPMDQARRWRAMQQNQNSMGGNSEGLTSWQRNMGMNSNFGDIPGMLNRGDGRFLGGGGRFGFSPERAASFYGAGGPGNINTGDGTGFWSGLGKSLGSGVESFFGEPLQAANTLLGIGDYFQKGEAMDQYGDYLGMLKGQMGEQKAMSDKTWDAFTRQRDRDEARVAKYDKYIL